MPLEAAAAGRTPAPRDVTWSSKDAILYALGVGCGTADLQFTTENSHEVPQQVLPTFAVIIGLSADSLRHVGAFSWSHLVHGGQSIRTYRPFPAEGAARVSERVVSLEDKGPGKNAVVVTAARITEAASGELLAETTMTVVIRGAGGFAAIAEAGGTAQDGTAADSSAPGSTARWQRADRDPDVTRVFTTSPDQALIYRLSGDRNPLHSDPYYAVHRARFPAPILHGLCTYGYAGRALLAELCAGDVARFGEFGGRFTAPVFPGEQLTVRIWREPRGATFDVLAGDDAHVVIDAGRFTLTDADRP